MNNLTLHKHFKAFKPKARLLTGTYIFLILTVVFLGCQNNSKHTSDFDKLQRSLVSPDSSFMQAANSEAEVYYFHYTRRCATCNAVEETTIQALKEFYGDKVKFTSLNLDDDEPKIIAKSMEVNGQSLVIMANGKKFDLTNEAFMHALNNPDKLKHKIKATLDPLL